ncbi:hypothetical protein [Nannocystis punicea]|uniref:WD40 repeat domain-containing protein n=1 Tax=Nannocystis punicea TaxID=2995304 RepID=A0ABY7GSG9_9BACT|nr:hypothetical protein [Nannocystis poenicansa]WAS89885.1 hypothetical protein O0S08_27140 [Nannocystis poenicansa]
MIAFDSTGRNLVLADDAEFLVHDGPSEGPRWRRDCKSPLIAVGATADAVISVDEDGQAVWHDPQRDVQRATAEAGDLARAAAISPSGHVLVATSDGAVELTPSGPGRRHAWPDATVVAWGVGGQILVADQQGKVGVFGPAGLVLEVQLEAPPVAATWNARGFWIVATARKLLRIEGGALHHLTGGPADMPIRAVASSLGGDAIAMVLGESLVIVLSWPGRDNIGQLRYLDRVVDGVQFGPEPWLAVGLDGGDGNKFDLGNGNLNRTDTHPGREHRRWMVSVSVNPPQPAEPSAPPQPAAEAQPAAKPKASLLLFTVVALIVLYTIVRFGS